MFEGVREFSRILEMSLDKMTERIMDEETVEEEVSPRTTNLPYLNALNPHSRVFENIRSLSGGEKHESGFPL